MGERLLRNLQGASVGSPLNMNNQDAIPILHQEWYTRRQIA
jgi:hypothetical protein